MKIWRRNWRLRQYGGHTKLSAALYTVLHIEGNRRLDLKCNIRVRRMATKYMMAQLKEMLRLQG